MRIESKAELHSSVGNLIYVAPAGKVFSNIEIADNISIGANAVVNKSFIESGITIAGVPARKVKERVQL